MKNTKKSYQDWMDSNNLSVEFLGKFNSQEVSEDLLKAEPDLVAAPEPNVPEDLAAAIEVIQDGALQELSPTQQHIFQLSIVEGVKDKKVMAELGIDKAAFKYHLKQIGFVLRKKTLSKMQGL